MRWLDGTLAPIEQPGGNILYNQHFICEQKKKSVLNFRILTVPPIFPGVLDYKESEGQKYRVRC